MWQLRRWLSAPAPVGSARVKIVGLAAIAAVPIMVLASVVVEETFAGASQAARHAVSLVEAGSLARYQASVADLHRSLVGMSQALPVDPAQCDATLKREMDRDPARWAGLLVRDAAGLVRCQMGGIASGSIPSNHGLGVFSLSHRDQGDHAVATLAQVDGSTLIALLQPGWFGDSLAQPAGIDSAAWLLDQDGGIVAVSGPAAVSVPQVATMQRLLRGNPGTLVARAAAGRMVAYAAMPLPDGWRLIQADDAQREYRQASNAVLGRLAALAVLLLIGLTAIMAAAAITFGEPLRRVSKAVTSWKAGGRFEPGPLAGAPWEVRELAHWFGEATATLQQRGHDLTEARERQDLLVLEIHHRVKNNLQIVASLLNLQASRIRLPEARAEFQAARDRVRALATLHRHLYSDGELHTINMRSFLVELCDQLFQAMGEKPGDRIVLAIEAPELRMSSDQAVPLALIVTEAVTNSVKYAFPAGRRGRVSVRLLERDGELDLLIEDNGIGIPSGSAMTEAGTRDGLGRQLIRGFARQLGASLAVEEGHGTRYAVRLPRRPSKPDGSRRTPEPLDAA